MRILVVVTFGGLSFWLTPLPVLLIRSIQQRHAGLEFDSVIKTLIPPPLSFSPGRRVWATLQKGPTGPFTYLCEPPARSRSLPTTRRFAGTHHRLVQQPNQLAPRRCTLAEKSERIASPVQVSQSVSFILLQKYATQEKQEKKGFYSCEALRKLVHRTCYLFSFLNFIFFKVR